MLLSVLVTNHYEAVWVMFFAQDNNDILQEAKYSVMQGQLTQMGNQERKLAVL